MMTLSEFEKIKAMSDSEFIDHIKGKPRPDVPMLVAWRQFAVTDDCETFLNTASSLGLSGNQEAMQLFESLIPAKRHRVTSGIEGFILDHFEFDNTLA